MLRVLDVVEKNVIDIQLPPIVVGAAASTQVIPDSNDLNKDCAWAKEEVAYIEIYNNGPGTVYYNFGANCDNLNNFKAQLLANQMLEVKTREKVTVYQAAGGAIISRTVLIRSTTMGIHQ